MAAPGYGLNHAGVDGGDEIHDCIKVFARDIRFQRPLDTPVASRLAPAAQRNRQANEGLLAFREPGVCVNGGEVVAKGRFSHVQLLTRTLTRSVSEDQSLRPPRLRFGLVSPGE